MAASQNPLGLAAPGYMFGIRTQPRFLTVTDAFLHHVSTRPDAIAARDLSSKSEPSLDITYGDLAKRSARLAQRLRQFGVVPGSRVPLVVKRGIDMLVGIMSILTCGAQYVPLDGGVVPDSTLRFVTEQAGGRSCTVLTLKSTRHRVDACGAAHVVCIDEVDDAQEDLYAQNSPSENLAQPDGGCYVIYTSGEFRPPRRHHSEASCVNTSSSGTTGRPKGVDVTHRNACNLICNAPGSLGITYGTRVSQVLNISFDMGKCSATAATGQASACSR